MTLEILPSSDASADLRAVVREKYGAEPSVTYFETPVVVDNVSDEIVAG